MRNERSRKRSRSNSPRSRRRSNSPRSSNRRSRSPNKDRRKRSNSPRKHDDRRSTPERVEENLRREAEKVKKYQLEKMEKNKKLYNDDDFDRTLRVPISLDHLEEKAKKMEEDSKNPVFMSREERQRQAIAKREEQARLEKEKKLKEKQKREELIQEMKKDKYQEKKNERMLRRRDDQLQQSLASMRAPAPSINDEEMDDRELERIRNSYLGIKQKKKRVIKTSEKTKFVFDWDIGEDTSRDVNPLYDKKVGARPLFGRGFIAGIDEQDQYKMFGGKKDKKRLAKGKLSMMDDGKHWSEKKINEMTARDWRILREDFSISTRGGSIPSPIRTWDESGLPENILKALKIAGYKKPTAIQMQAIPLGLENRDILAIAETGSGKTASFVIPLMVYISKLPKISKDVNDGPYAIILAPTRELAQQIEQETQKFASYMGIRCLSIVGGVNMNEQDFELRSGVELVIATPGRLIDFLERRYLVLNQCSYIVMDEADRMIDMHFEEQIISILDMMPTSYLKSENEEIALQQERDTKNSVKQYRTTVMFSATMPVTVERLARKYLRHPAYITIGIIGRAVERIRQHVFFVKGEHDKRERLKTIIHDFTPPIIVFVARKTAAKTLCKWLVALGHRATALHSGKKQEAREEAIEGIKNATYDILVATNVAGRGIDIPDITHVINYDCPTDIQEYTHKIGRTARAGEKGDATTFLTKDDHNIFYDLKKMLQETNNPVPHELLEMETTKPSTSVVPTSSNKFLK